MRLFENIELCPECKGMGYHEQNVLIDHHKGDYQQTRSACSLCCGSGRITREKLPDIIRAWEGEL